ncbi:MAG: zinc-ribbon domain containing protein [Oscillospiraceae bacterium]|nr:zinc-ribbon domain containing protein [Oscillospiraceae bacterium]
MAKYLQCKECTRIFSFPEEDQEAFRQKGWCEPVRCARCREVAKKRRRDPYWGWESTMGNSIGIKKRHHRVNYPVHVVGGFR